MLAIMARLQSISVVLFGCFIALASSVKVNSTTNDNALTFDWYDGVIPEKVCTSTDRACPGKYEAEGINLYKDLNGVVKLQDTNFSTEYPDSVSWRKSAGFVDTVFYGYKQHHNVIIRPDDVWTAIMVQFSLYVNANAEALRTSFVNFEGKKQLIVKFRSRIDRVDIREFISRITELIHENTDPTLNDWALPNFTTTTENDRITAGAALMSTLQEYFDYELWGIICGIPKATILGTVKDWEDIRERVKRLETFEVEGKTVMRQWSALLGRVLDQFVSVKKGNAPDPVFWKEAIRVDYRIIDVVCAKINETTLNGWITTFTAFSLSGKWRGTDETLNDTSSQPWLKVKTDKITPGIVHVPIKIHDEYAEEEEQDYNGAIIVGHTGFSVKQDETTIQPFSGWIMLITDHAPQYFGVTAKPEGFQKRF